MHIERFRKSEAALILTHLVFLAYILLIQILRYTLTKTVPSMAFIQDNKESHPSHGSERKPDRDSSTTYVTN
jgi:hypothetical protein